MATCNYKDFRRNESSVGPDRAQGAGSAHVVPEKCFVVVVVVVQEKCETGLPSA